MLPGFNTLILLSSSLFVWMAERALRKDKRRGAMAWLAGALIAGVLFIVIQLHEWHQRPYGISSNLYGSLYFTITGFHLLHVAAGLIILGMLFLWTALGYFDRRRTEALKIGGLYWHFVDAVWIFIFTTFFLTPYMVRI
jgi:cytochrome c oxidase subunit 3